MQLKLKCNINAASDLLLSRLLISEREKVSDRRSYTHYLCVSKTVDTWPPSYTVTFILEKSWYHINGQLKLNIIRTLIRGF